MVKLRHMLFTWALIMTFFLCVTQARERDTCYVVSIQSGRRSELAFSLQA